MDENENNVKVEQAAEKSQEIIGVENLVSTEQKPAKRVLIRREFAIRLVIIVALVILVPLVIGMLLDRTFNSGINSAEEQISIRTEFIERIDIPGFSLTSIQSSAGGDSLTANASSAVVSAEFNGALTTGKLIEESIDEYMSDQGYSKSDEYRAFYRGDNFKTGKNALSWINVQYSNESQRYIVNYLLEESFECPEGYQCLAPWDFGGDADPGYEKYDLGSLLDKEYKTIRINNGGLFTQRPSL